MQLQLYVVLGGFLIGYMLLLRCSGLFFVWFTLLDDVCCHNVVAKMFWMTVACYYLVVSVLIGNCKVVASVLWMVAQESIKIPVP